MISNEVLGVIISLVAAAFIVLLAQPAHAESTSANYKMFDKISIIGTESTSASYLLHSTGSGEPSQSASYSLILSFVPQAPQPAGQQSNPTVTSATDSGQLITAESIVVPESVDAWQKANFGILIGLLPIFAVIYVIYRFGNARKKKSAQVITSE